MFVALVVLLPGLVLFAAGTALSLWAARRLLAGFAGLARVLGISVYAAGAALTGFQASHIAMGLVAAREMAPAIALGVLLGGAIFHLCVTLGLRALRAPFAVRLPGGMLVLFAVAPLGAGLALPGSITARLAGLGLLCFYVVAIVYVATSAARRGLAVAKEVEWVWRSFQTLGGALARALVGMVALGVGGSLVAQGMVDIGLGLHLPPLFTGMVVAPAGLALVPELRRARGHLAELTALDLLGAQLSLLLCGLGALTLFVPVPVSPLVRTFDWVVLLSVSWFVALLFWRGRVGALAGVILLMAYTGFVVMHVLSPA